MSTVPQTPPTPAPPLPPLVAGERLTREEFERRYDAMPELKKAELIEGVVHMPSPVRLQHHGMPHSEAIGWLLVYRAGTPGTGTADNASIRLDNANMPQPDAALFLFPSHGGQARISADDYLEGGPELIVEVAASSASLDLNERLRVYERAGVREYLVWRVPQRRIDWFVLRVGTFSPLKPDSAGCFRSEVFPGLWLNSAALLRGDIAAVLATLQEGLASPEHTAFVAALQQRAGGH
jgi:Uma2 family endonuclease